MRRAINGRPLWLAPLTQRCSAGLVITALLGAPARPQEAPPKIDLSAAIARALTLAEDIKIPASRIALLNDIARLQAKASDTLGAQTTLARALRAAAAIQATGERCEVLAKFPTSMLRAGAPDIAAWMLKESEGLIVNRQTGQGWLGIKMEDFRKNKEAESASSGLDGVLVLEVDVNSPAARAGIEDGDVITALADRPMSTAAELHKLLATIAPGQRIAVQLVREGEAKSLQVELGVRAATIELEDACRAQHVDNHLRLAVFYAGLGDNASSEHQLEEAARVTFTISDQTRYRATAALASTQAALGHVDAALTAIRAIGDSYRRVSSLMGIAATLQANEKTAEASSIINEAFAYAADLADQRNKTTALYSMVDRLITLGHVALAERAARGMEPDNRQVRAYIAIAKGHAKAGDGRAATLTLSQALQTVSKIDDPNEQAESITSLAGAQIDVGPLPGLLAAAARIQNARARLHALRSIAMASSDLGDSHSVEDAIGMLESEERKSILREIDEIRFLKSQASGGPREVGPIDGALAQISSSTTTAIAEFRKGKLPSARSHLRSAKSSAYTVPKEHKDDAWRMVVEAQATIGDMNDALASAEQIRDPSSRLWTLQEFVFERQRLLSNRRQLRVTALAMAAAAAQLQEDPSSGPSRANASIRTIRLMFLIETLTELGELAAAKRLVEMIPEEPDWSRKIDALRYIAKAQVRAGSIVDALETLAVARSALGGASVSSRADRLQDFARLQTAMGDQKGAWSWSVALPAPLEGARSFLGIAEADLSPAHVARLNSLPEVRSTPDLLGYTLGQRPSEDTEAQVAITKNSEAIARDNRNAAAYAERGEVYSRLGRYDLAIADCDKALALRPNAALVYFNRGNILFQQGKYDAAIADYRNAIRLDGTYEPAYFMRGRAELAMGDTQRAIVDLTQAIKLDAKHVHALVQLALAHTKQREYARAMGDFDAAIRLNPFQAGYHNGRALVLLSMGKFTQALEETSLALALDSNNAYALDARGRAYEALGSREEALRTYRAALSINPDLPHSVQGLKRLQALH